MFSDVRQLCCIRKQPVLVMKTGTPPSPESQLHFCCFWSELKVSGQVFRVEGQCVCWGAEPRPRVHVGSRDCDRVVLSRCVEVCFDSEVCFVSVSP